MREMRVGVGVIFIAQVQAWGGLGLGHGYMAHEAIGLTRGSLCGWCPIYILY